jgi:hypothetical protein
MKNIISGTNYRERKQKLDQTQEVELPSGAVFLLRPVDLEVFAVSGALPLSIAEKMNTAQSGGLTETEAFRGLSEDEKQKSFNFARKLLQYNSVSPRIVDEPRAEDELSVEDLLPEDLRFLLDWSKEDKTGQVGNFRSGSDALASASRPKRRTAAK